MRNRPVAPLLVSDERPTQLSGHSRSGDLRRATPKRYESSRTAHRFGQAGVTSTGGKRTDYRGYILFAAPGDWKVTVRRGKSVIGSVVYRVTTTS
jgi:hypothetical protein